MPSASFSMTYDLLIFLLEIPQSRENLRCSRELELLYKPPERGQQHDRVKPRADTGPNNGHGCTPKVLI
ncbi:hypothetical protein EUGRSUZ_H01096 [Eucalyptus grandis]|uniref:Uncharacterized protein n=2 Tax=Eucalyptus grandis TaxID=71139 RepID=A0ACC3JP45_EUCGR|nr:hypothetical protein EUGRSUZ_H01096 [Eucalyptus grandis]